MYRMDELKKSIPENIFEHVSEYIVNRSRAILYVKEDTLQRKINSFELGQRRVPRVDRNVVKNLSSRILSNDETDCLAHGLDYGLVPKNTDDMNIVSNIENFFHRITDISQHHKKLMSEVNDKDTVDGADVRVLNSKEMTLASSFRSITDSFRHQVYRFAQLHNRINTEQQKCCNVLKNLKEDKSIVVTRPDKGRGVVLLDKVDYLSKMHTILNDSTKFSFLSYDPTIIRETKLIKLLNKLLDEGTISKDFYNLAKPFGSIPGRLYGLPKVHREDIPLRPIVSAIRTFNYGLGKALSQLLSQFIEKKNMIRDSFSFVKELLALPKYSIIRRQLNLIYTPSTPISLPSLTTDTVVLRVPYFGPLSQVYAKRIISATNKNYPLKRIRLIYDVKERVGTGFTLKDPIPDQMQAGVVYEATCPECKVYYIGKTFRHFKTRTHEHLHYQKQDLCLKKTAKSKHTVKRNSSTIKTSVQRKGSITRSQTGKLPPLSVQSIQQEIAKLVKNPEIIQTNIKPPTPKAAIAKHYYTTGHTFTNDDFNIRIKERYKYKLSIKESLLIKQKKPPLNKGIRSVPLYIYADGIEQNNARKQKQRTIPDTSIRTTNQD
ncbi:unnamed protein product [Rotaria sp. Silwood2]|nr:unnamed protein product [Rotaria sp. Silwood2]CAF3023152.1 unnamed protein product [Rotaria sp. Silwood2]CAF4171940.1 unnamed protein product [Rotaria sp. Silwood2]CAF4172376.1 unnamed protein product [Rotaria sp. Silwood2]CAF4256019.1 unnamed protein product [Rotaria sp. Silwood2]